MQISLAFSVEGGHLKMVVLAFRDGQSSQAQLINHNRHIPNFISKF